MVTLKDFVLSQSKFVCVLCVCTRICAHGHMHTHAHTHIMCGGFFLVPFILGTQPTSEQTSPSPLTVPKTLVLEQHSSFTKAILPAKLPPFTTTHWEVPKLGETSLLF